MFDPLSYLWFLAYGLTAYAASVVAEIPYLLTVRRALTRCAPQNRTMSPGFVWLQLVPLLGLAWWFTNISVLSESFEREYRSRVLAVQRPNQTLGRAAGWLRIGALWFLSFACSWLSIANFYAAEGLDPGSNHRTAIVFFSLTGLFALACLVAWIMYWARIAGISRHLAGLGPLPEPEPKPVSRRRLRLVPPIGSPAVPAGDFCHNCGLLLPAGGVCPRCGAREEEAGRMDAGASGPSRRKDGPPPAS